MTLTEDDEVYDKNTTAIATMPASSKTATEPITATVNSPQHTNSNPSVIPPANSNISLSPAVSAFQQFWPSTGHTSPLALSSSPNDAIRKNYSHMSPSITRTGHGDSTFPRTFDSNSFTTATTAVIPPVDIKDGYVYKDKVVILDQAKKEQLLKVGTILLQGEWTYWYDRYVPNLPASEYEANLQVISTVGTVQKFWSVYNNIDGPDKLGFRSNLHFMRKGIKPIWEDPKNEYGGSYNFKVSKHQSPLVWRDLLVLLIGEKIEQCLQDTLCGVSVSSRQHCDNYQIWVSSGQDKNDNGTAIKSTLADLLSPADIQSFYFKVHKNHAAFQKDDGPIKLYRNNNSNSNNNSVYTKYNNGNSNNTNGSPIITRPAPPPSPAPIQLTEMRQKITEENIERVVADIERLGLKQKSIRKVNSRNSIASSS